jgi:hypothetical protein
VPAGCQVWGAAGADTGIVGFDVGCHCTSSVADAGNGADGSGMAGGATAAVVTGSGTGGIAARGMTGGGTIVGTPTLVGGAVGAIAVVRPPVPAIGAGGGLDRGGSFTLSRLTGGGGLNFDAGSGAGVETFWGRDGFTDGTVA